MFLAVKDCMSNLKEYIKKFSKERKGKTLQICFSVHCLPQKLHLNYLVYERLESKYDCQYLLVTKLILKTW